MSKLIKADILTTCLKKQQELVDHFERQIEETKSIAFEHSETPSQTDEGSTSPDVMLGVLAEELAMAQTEMNILRGIDPNDPAHVVERGAVVITNHRTFFIGVSSEEVHVNGTPVFGMSEKAPLYSHMRGLKKGDAFSFNQMHYQIEDIF